MSKPKYLSYKTVDKIINDNALHYLLMIGQRSNGKSYSAKELVLRHAFKNDRQFTYLRRHKEDIQDYMILEYFADMLQPNDKGRNKIQIITRDTYNTITIYKKGIYFASQDEEGKILNKTQIGYAHALSGLEGLKSRQFPLVDYTLFEEFIATNLYLWDECNKMQQYSSTIYRNRPGCVIMIGNSISRIVPYFTEWQLDNIPRMAPGTFDLYKFTTNGTETRIGVFLCESLQSNSGMFFGQAAKMIVGGEWERSEQPRPADDIEHYETIYTIVFAFSETAKYLMTLVRARDDHTKMFWYVEPKTSEIKPGTRVVCPTFNENALYTMDFTPITEKERVPMEYIKRGKIAFSDNLTGTEFKRCVEQLRKR